MNDFAQWKALLAVEKEKERKLKEQLADIQKHITNIGYEIAKYETDYVMCIPDNNYRHAIDESHSAYSRGEVTLCGKWTVKYSMDYEEKYPVCPECVKIVQARGVKA